METGAAPKTESGLSLMGCAAAHAVPDGVRGTDAATAASIVGLREQLIQQRHAAVHIGDDLGAKRDEVVSQRAPPVEVERKTAQMVDRLLAKLPQASAFATELADRRGSFVDRRRLDVGGLLGRHRRDRLSVVRLAFE